MADDLQASGVAGARSLCRWPKENSFNCSIGRTRPGACTGRRSYLTFGRPDPPREEIATELKEAANRILLHAKLLIGCAVLGTLVAFIALSGPPRYVASTRLLVSGTTDKTGSGSTADTVAAIATSRSQLVRALGEVGVARDLDGFVRDVSVHAVGTTGVVELSVVDEDRAVAASLANTLTANVSQAMRDARLVGYPLPSLIDSATPSAAKAIPPIRLQDLALGALLGLILGIGAAALLEALDPTVVGREAIAAELGVPVLGELSLTPMDDSVDLSWVRWQLGAQAGRAGVATVKLTNAGPDIDLLPLSAALVTNGATPPPRRASGPGGVQPSTLKVGILDRTDVASISPDGSAGLVVVTPKAVKKADVEAAKELARITGCPTVGAIVYRRRWASSVRERPGGGAETAGAADLGRGPGRQQASGDPDAHAGSPARG